MSVAALTTFGFGSYSDVNIAVVFGYGSTSSSPSVWVPGYSPRPPLRQAPFVLGQARQDAALLRRSNTINPSLRLLRQNGSTLIASRTIVPILRILRNILPTLGD